jgi:hypothetical protein
MEFEPEFLDRWPRIRGMLGAGAQIETWLERYPYRRVSVFDRVGLRSTEPGHPIDDVAGGPGQTRRLSTCRGKGGGDLGLNHLHSRLKPPERD